MRSLRLIKAKIAYAYARLKADSLAGISGRRQFVLMTDGGKLVVMDKSLFYRMRKRGSMPKNITPRMLPSIAVYYTKGTHNAHSVPPMTKPTADGRRQRYLKYVSSLS